MKIREREDKRKGIVTAETNIRADSTSLSSKTQSTYPKKMYNSKL